VATSNSVDFTVTRDNLVKYALLNVGGIGDGESPSSNQLTDCSMILNMIAKAWHSDGMPLWALKEGYILPVSDTNQVLLGPSGGHATLSYVHATLTASSAGVTIDIADTTGISNTNSIGVELDDGTMHWTTVNGVPTATVITLTSGLASTASVGNHVYAYAAKIQRPLKILEAISMNMGNPPNTEVEVQVTTHNDFFFTSDTTSESSQALKLWYDPQLINGIVSIWPRFQDGGNIIKIWFHRPFEDFDAAGDNPDFPQEFYLPLLWQLSWAISPQYGVQLKERTMFLQEAAILKKAALDFVMEEGSLRISPNV